MPESLSKKDSDTGVFRWVLRNFFEYYFFIEHLWTVASGFFSQLGNKQQNWKQLFRASYDANPLNLIGWPSESSVKRIKPCLNYLKKTYQILRSNFFWSFSFFFLLIFSSLLSTALRNFLNWQAQNMIIKTKLLFPTLDL